MRPAKVTWDEAIRAYVMSDNSITDAPGYAAATAIVEADRAELVAEIVAWLRAVSDPGATFQDRRLAYQLAAANFANEIEAKWGKV